MGKSLKGKELGVGISQRPDGTYTGRITDANGKRIQKYFKKLQDCRQWVSEKQFSIEHGNALSNNPTVSACFEYWLKRVKKNQIKESTMINYTGIWEKHIKKVVGDKLITDIKPIHCLEILQKMSDKGYKTSTIKGTRMILKSFFLFCLENKIIADDPMNRNVKAFGEESKSKRVLTVEEQRDFLINTKDSSNSRACAFILQTGLRYGELTALEWSDIDFGRKTMHITKSMTYKNSGGWEITGTKTKSSVRTIPLTPEAIRILREQKEINKSIKIIDMRFRNLVFVNQKGRPRTNNTYNIFLKNYCKKENIERFSIHTLRHTFATRCIEAGMRPKTLQKIMGHANLAMTMDLYVHVTEESKIREMEMVEKMLKIV